MTYAPSQGGILIQREKFVPGTVKPEEDYAELERLSAKLGIPCPQSFIEIEVQDKDGEVVEHFKDRSRTLNRNFWNWLFMGFAAYASTPGGTNGFTPPNGTTFGAGFLSFKQITGSLYGTASSLYVPATVVAASTVTGGIVVGTGTTAESFDGFVLATPIATGTASGQLSYQAQAAATNSYNSGTLTWTGTMTRIMNNNSGGTIGVNETAIYAQTPTSPIMIARDKLSSTVNVLTGGQLTVTYTHTLTFPA